MHVVWPLWPSRLPCLFLKLSAVFGIVGMICYDGSLVWFLVFPLVCFRIWLSQQPPGDRGRGVRDADGLDQSMSLFICSLEPPKASSSIFHGL